MKQTFDPKLKMAEKEIEEILKKHDILASMLLVSPSHCEFLFHLEASWSVMKFEDYNDGSAGIRFRSKKADFPNKEAQHFATHSTVHALTSFLQFGKMTQRNMESFLEALRKHMSIVYRAWDTIPDDHK